MQNPNMHRVVSNMDPEIVRMRQYMQEKIWQFLMHRHRQSPDVSKRKMIDIVKRLEEGLFKNVTTKEEYVNLATLKSRLHVLIERLPLSNPNQQFQHANPSLSVGTMIPTPGLHQPGNSNMHGLLHPIIFGLKWHVKASQKLRAHRVARAAGRPGSIREVMRFQPETNLADQVDVEVIRALNPEGQGEVGGVPEAQPESKNKERSRRRLSV